MHQHLFTAFCFVIILVALSVTVHALVLEEIAGMLHIPSHLTLWAVGMLLVLSVWEHIESRKPSRYLLRNPSVFFNDNQPNILLPERRTSSLRFLYLFLFSLLLWVLTLLLSGKAYHLLSGGTSEPWSEHVRLLAGGSVALSGLAVGVALRSFREVCSRGMSRRETAS